MAGYAVRRLLGAVPLLLVTSFIVFSFLHIAPGSPEKVLLAGKNVDSRRSRRSATSTTSTTRSSFQFWHWLTNVVQGDLSESIIFHHDSWRTWSARGSCRPSSSPPTRS